MIQFLQPIWLWAITAVLIPVIIHLWNIREGKTLKVGSIAFLSEATRSHAKSVRLSELLLLLLRCLLLILVALLLARPVWTGKRDTNTQQGWILLPPGIAPQAYQQFQATIDSLRKQGHTLHRFEEGFPEMKSGTDTANSIVTHNYWQLLTSLNQHLPAGSPVYLFTDNQRRHFMGSRPAVALNLHWQTFALPDTANWTAAAFRTINDSTRILTANSNNAGIFYTAKNIRGTGDSNAIDICIYTDVYAADANYLRAALAATRDFTKRKINISLVTRLEAIPSKNSWLFWLADKPLQQKSAQHVFAYTPGKMKSIHAALNTGGNDGGALLCYRIIDNPTKLLAVWTAGADQMVLGKDPRKNELYQFNSRFQPQWNDLVWSEQFPKLIAQLILPKNEDQEPLSVAAIDHSQIQPGKVDAALLLPGEKAAAGSSLDPIGWLLIFCCLFIERWLSFTTKSRRS